MAEITLPRAGVGSFGRRARSRVPNAFDVPTVAPPRDPGVNITPRVPPGAFGGNIGRALEGAGRDLTAFGLVVHREAERQQRRHDATKTTESLLTFQREGMEEFRRRQVEDDPARPGFMRDFQTFLEGRQNQGIEGLDEDVSEEAKVALRLRMQSAADGMVNSAGRLSIAAGRQQANDAIGKVVNQLSAQVTLAPDAIEDVLNELSKQLAPFDDTSSPDQERANLRGGRQTLILSAVEGYVRAERFEDAKILLHPKVYGQELTREQRVRAENMIERGERNAITRANRAEAATEKELKEARDFRAAELTAGILDGTVTAADVDAAMDNREISGSQAIAARKLVKAQESEDALEDDPAVVLQFRSAQLLGVLTAPEVLEAYGNKQITRERMDSFLRLIKEDPRDFNTKEQARRLAQNIGGQSGPAAILGDDETRKVNTALDIFDGLVAAGMDPFEARKQIEAQALEPQRDPLFINPRFMVMPTGEVRDKSKMDIRATRKATAKAHRNGKITDQEMFEQLDLIRQIEEERGGQP